METIQKFLLDIRLSEFTIPTTVKISDIIDILIVAFLIYTILMWIKETRAWSLFKGILTILGFSVFAMVFELNTIWFVLKNTLSVGITAVIVIFSPELRNALEQLGRTHLNSRKVNVNTATTEEIVVACQKMAAVKTGAIILLEKVVKLGDHVKKGIPIDANVKSELLINIFEHNTPLHDGAVIIRNNRIAAATCFLPMTGRTDLSMELGSRHRAAIGASEVSDALVIVVSEETGNISVAQKGNLNRNITGERLREIINENFQEPEKKTLMRGKKKNE